MYGLLMLCFDYSNVNIDEFNDWYDTEHIPERERTRGILNANRWLTTSNRRISVASYDLETIDVLAYPEYLAISGKNLSPWSKRIVPACKQLLRFEGRQIYPGSGLASKSASLLLLIGVKLTPVLGLDTNEVYRAHASRVEKIPGLEARFFKSTNESVDFLEMYELASAELLKSEHWRRADDAHAFGAMSRRAGLNILCERYRRTTGEHPIC